MFGFLKKKLKEATDKFKKKVEEVEETTEELEQEVIEESKKESILEKLKKRKIEPEEETEEPVKKKSFFEKKKQKQVVDEDKKPLLEKVKEKEVIIEKEPEEEKKGFFSKLKQKVSTRKINDEQFEEFFYDLEIALLENNVAMEVIEKLKEELKMELVNVPLSWKGIENKIKETLENTIKEILQESEFDLIKNIRDKKEKPYVVLFIGVNGSGKTTSIAKIANYLKEKKINSIIAAADTFRAASIEQLEMHGKNLGIRIIKHQYGSDPAAVVYDAINHAKARNVDCVLIDTAGRQHSNEDLMNEMKKINKIAKPDLTLFVGEAITGNDCVEQVKKFNEFVNLDGIFLSKLDIDEKGGAALSVSYVSGKPILFVGTGQKYGDIKKFDKNLILDNLGL